jgi:hypothetical protein
MTHNKRFFTLAELSHLPKPTWAIEGLFEVGSLVMLAAPSYSFKSFMAIDWMLSMATGREWNGRKTTPSTVAYVLGEGRSGLLKRINSWILYHKPTDEQLKRLDENFRVTFDVAQLASKASVDNMLSDLTAENYKPNVLVIDTFARSTVGIDENHPKDAGLWIDGADRLRQNGYTVVFLHHTKKSTEFGVQYRGSTAIMGAMDTAMTMVRENNFCTMTITKQKDHDEGKPLRFRREVVVTEGDTDGSMVLVPAPLMDERFAPDYDEYGRIVEAPQEASGDSQSDDLIARLLEDPRFQSDRARARELASAINISENAANLRISRAKAKRYE